MARNAGDIKAAGLGYQQRPAEGLIPIQSLIDNARRDVRERGGGAQGLFNPHTSLPVPDTSQPGPGRAFARNLMRGFFTTQDFGNTGAFSDNPNPQAQARLNAAQAAFNGYPLGQVSMLMAGRGMGPQVGPGSPVGGGFMGRDPRVTTGIPDEQRDVLSGISLGFGLSGVGFVPSLTNRFFANTPGVIGDIAPKVGTESFAKHVAMGRLAGALGRNVSGTGVRGGKALGAQGIRGL
jgi:hypothetical protein